MSNINYYLNNKGIRLIDAKDVWIKTKSGKLRLNPKYNFIGKVDMKVPNIIITASEKVKQKKP